MCIEKENKVISSVEKKPFGLPEEAKYLFTNDWGYQVHVTKLTDKTNQSMGFQVVDMKGQVSEMVIKKVSQLSKATGFDFIYDLAGDFIRDDVIKIKANYKKVESTLKPLYRSDRSPFLYVYRDLCRVELLDDIITRDQTPDGVYLNISVEKGYFKTLVEEQGWGWTDKEVKRKLRDLGLLRVNKGRPYDFKKVDKDGTGYRTISFRLGMGGDGE